MRLITASPKDSVPDLLESDIDNCLIIAHIKRDTYNKIIYAIKWDSEKTFNWFGDDVSGQGYTWGHLYQGTLLEFLAKSWEHWVDVPKMYICETMEDVILACDEIGVTNDVLRFKICRQFNKIKELAGANHNDNNRL